MYKRNVPLIIIISILILMLALVSWQLLKINNTLTSLQQQISMYVPRPTFVILPGSPPAIERNS